MEAQPRFGRIQAPDERDRRFGSALLIQPLLEQFFARGLPPGERHYRPGPVLDQGDTGTCVGHGWAGWLQGAPIMSKPYPGLYPFDLYDACTQIDEFPDNDHDTARQLGTSVRAGAKVLQRLGHIQSYLWAKSAEDVRAWHLAGFGTLVLGVNWYGGMMQTDHEGFIDIEGDLEGGHCVKTTGWSDERNAVRIQNSWGRGWGEHGRAWLRADALQRLLDEDGDACAAVEIKVVPQEV